jgi:hypothetical protein
MGSVSVVATLKWFWLLISIAGIVGVLVLGNAAVVFEDAVVFKRAAE